MVFAYDMGGYYQLPLGMLIEEMYEDVLVGLPAAACHKHRTILLECLNKREVFRLSLDLQHAVETRVATDSNIRYPYRGKQLAAQFVLHEEMSETPEHTGILPGIPFEENLVGTENRRYTISRNTTMLKYVKIVIPKLILDEESHHRPHQSQEAYGIYGGVERQVAYYVGTLVILAHLIARRGEEGQEYLVFRMLLAQTLNNGASLFKLSE